jgi:hypothetical protein
MKIISAFFAVALAILWASSLARAEEIWIPGIPPELSVSGPIDGVIVERYRCSDGLVYNGYHGALYDGPPAVYRGYAYRPYYRYTAARLHPRTYACNRIR